MYQSGNTDLFGVCSVFAGLLCALATGGFVTAGFTIGGLVGRGGAAMMYSKPVLHTVWLNVFQNYISYRYLFVHASFLCTVCTVYITKIVMAHYSVSLHLSGT